MVVDRTSFEEELILCFYIRLWLDWHARNKKESNDGFVRAKSRENLVSWVECLINPVYGHDIFISKMTPSIVPYIEHTIWRLATIAAP